MKVLVTGGAGFIGSHIADRLLNDGHEVVILDDLSTGHVEHLNPVARFYQMEIQSPWLDELFKIERPEAVLHQAAQASVRRSVEDPGFDASVNVLGTVSLLQASVRHGVQRFLYASSCSLYGVAGDELVAEDAPFSPTTPYGESKALVERALSSGRLDPYTQVRLGLPSVEKRVLRASRRHHARARPSVDPLAVDEEPDLPRQYLEALLLARVIVGGHVASWIGPHLGMQDLAFP